MKNCDSRKIRAFSLIEISIVILIIGILIAGITQSSRLVREVKIKTANSITISSPVNSTRNLDLWLEPAMEQSFISNEANDGSQISQWNDINPQSASKFFAIKTASSAITYQRDGINDLPSIKFSGATGTNSSLTLSQSTNISDATLASTSDSFTFFAVLKLDSTVDSSDQVHRIAFYNGNSSANGWGYLRIGGNTQNGKRSVLFGGSLNDYSTTASLSAEVVSGTYDGVSEGGNVKLYINGVLQSLDSNTVSLKTPATSFSIGNNNGTKLEPWKGLISEIIIFHRNLKDVERIAIERYLGKKYGITVQ